MMMKVYKFWHKANEYKNINLEETLLLDKVIDGFYNDGKAFNCNFGSFKWIEEDLKECDFPMINGSIPVVSQRAYEVIDPYLDKEGIEILPITIDNIPYYIIHLLNVYDVLNEKRSVIQRFRNGDIMNIEKYVFLPSVSDAPNLFQITQNQMFVFAKEELFNAISEAKLTGADFEECQIKDYPLTTRLFRSIK